MSRNFPLRSSVVRQAGLVLGLFVSLASAAVGGEILAGFGRAPLPAPEGGPLAGYGVFFDRRAKGILDPPEARALVLEKDGFRIALITLDLVIIRPQMRETLIKESKSLNLAMVVLVATHTHSGPGGYIPGWWAKVITAGSFQPKAPLRILQATLRALEAAVSDLSPALVGSGTTKIILAKNRSFRDGPGETLLSVLRLDFREKGVPIVLFSYGVHPTILSAKNRAYSADYVGAAREWLDTRGWRSIFVPGPLGDQTPQSKLGRLWPDDLTRQEAQVKEVGEVLGRATLGVLESLPLSSDGEFVALERWVDTPPVRIRRFCSLWWFGPMVRGSLRKFISTRVPICTIRIHRAQIIALPAEPTSAIGTELRHQLLAERTPFVVAHANDWIGYVVTTRDYKLGSYEACFSFHGPELGPWLIQEAAETIRLLE